MPTYNVILSEYPLQTPGWNKYFSTKSQLWEIHHQHTWIKTNTKGNSSSRKKSIPETKKQTDEWKTAWKIRRETNIKNKWILTMQNKDCSAFCKVLYMCKYLHTAII